MFCSFINLNETIGVRRRNLIRFCGNEIKEYLVGRNYIKQMQSQETIEGGRICDSVSKEKRKSNFLSVNILKELRDVQTNSSHYIIGYYQIFKLKVVFIS